MILWCSLVRLKASSVSSVSEEQHYNTSITISSSLPEHHHYQSNIKATSLYEPPPSMQISLLAAWQSLAQRLGVQSVIPIVRYIHWLFEILMASLLFEIYPLLSLLRFFQGYCWAGRKGNWRFICSCDQQVIVVFQWTSVLPFSASVYLYWSWIRGALTHHVG